MTREDVEWYEVSLDTTMTALERFGLAIAKYGVLVSSVIPAAPGHPLGRGNSFTVMLGVRRAVVDEVKAMLRPIYWGKQGPLVLS